MNSFGALSRTSANEATYVPRGASYAFLLLPSVPLMAANYSCSILENTSVAPVRFPLPMMSQSADANGRLMVFFFLYGFQTRAHLYLALSVLSREDYYVPKVAPLQSYQAQLSKVIYFYIACTDTDKQFELGS